MNFRNLVMRNYLQIRYQMSDKVNKLIALEKLDSKAMQLIQKERLNGLLQHANNHVPYYRSEFRKSGVSGRDKKLHFERFSNIPLLDKSIIHTCFDELKSDDLPDRKWHFNTSGGSTGEPAHFIQDEDFANYCRSVKTLFDQWTGYYVGYPQVRLWGAEKDILHGGETVHARFGKWFRNECWLNAFKMSPEQMQQYVLQLNLFRPKQILAYVESIYELACYIEKKGLKVFTPQAIIVSAGTLFPDMRQTIERVFKTPVFNRYGSREVGDIACECKSHNGLHVSFYTHYVEILRPDATQAMPGETGEVVITSLTNYAMPLIRYRIGDLASWAIEPCDCGCTWPLLKEVAGRVTDLFTMRDGSKIYSGYFRRILYYRDWIKKYQFIQENLDYIRVLIVPKYDGISKESHDNEIEEIRQGISHVMGEGCKVEFEFVDEIPVTVSGKYRYMISKVLDKP